MLNKATTLKGYTLHSLDGEIGRIKEFYFDDHYWTIRYLVADTVEYPVQVNGKVRSHVTVAADAGRDVVEQAALADEKVQTFLAGATPKKVIVVPGRLVNIVA